MRNGEKTLNLALPEGKDSKAKIFKIESSDVLLGRGSGPNDHPGNVMYRDIIKSFANEYLNTTTKSEKRKIIEKAIDTFCKRGGRFLQRIPPPRDIHLQEDEESGKKIHDTGRASESECFELVERSAVFLRTRQSFRYLLSSKASSQESARKKDEGVIPGAQQLNRQNHGLISATQLPRDSPHAPHLTSLYPEIAATRASNFLSHLGAPGLTRSSALDILSATNRNILINQPAGVLETIASTRVTPMVDQLAFEEARLRLTGSINASNLLSLGAPSNALNSLPLQNMIANQRADLVARAMIARGNSVLYPGNGRHAPNPTNMSLHALLAGELHNSLRQRSIESRIAFEVLNEADKEGNPSRET